MAVFRRHRTDFTVRHRHANRTRRDTVNAKVFDDFRRTGEIEGLAFDPVSQELLVLANRGSRIVLGMPKGLYPGYDREIHEIYVYAAAP